MALFKLVGGMAHCAEVALRLRRNGTKITRGD